MRRYLLPFLLAVDLALAGVLAWQWVTPQGQLRDVRWVPPAPIKPVLTDSVLPTWSADLGSFIAALDRPLFSSTRKPPAKPEAAPAVVADTLGDVRVLGLYSTGGGAGGAIVRADGKVRRLRQGDALGGWTVKEIRRLELVLARGDESRAIEVKRGPDLAAAPAEMPAGAAAAAPSSAALNDAQQRAQRDQRDTEERTARVNAVRARLGMPPLP